jgi:hypothetical protein
MNPLLSKLRIGLLKRSTNIRILCYFNHHFGPSSDFVGKSTSSDRDKRPEIVYAALSRIRAMPFDMDIRVCGFKNFSLVSVDLDLSDIGNPENIVYSSIERMFEATDDYDYFLNIEDDILISSEVLTTIMTFTDSSELNEIYLPNRMEYKADGTPYCVDLLVVPGWYGLRRKFEDVNLDVAMNPHSGMLFLNREQMRYASSLNHH